MRDQRVMRPLRVMRGMRSRGRRVKRFECSIIATTTRRTGPGFVDTILDGIGQASTGLGFRIPDRGKGRKSRSRVFEQASSKFGLSCCRRFVGAGNHQQCRWVLVAIVKRSRSGSIPFGSSRLPNSCSCRCRSSKPIGCRRRRRLESSRNGRVCRRVGRVENGGIVFVLLVWVVAAAAVAAVIVVWGALPERRGNRTGAAVVRLCWSLPRSLQRTAAVRIHGTDAPLGCRRRGRRRGLSPGRAASAGHGGLHRIIRSDGKLVGRHDTYRTATKPAPVRHR